jgi:hypothetical protein
MEYKLIQQSKLIDSYNKSFEWKDVNREFIARRNENNNWEIEFWKTYFANTNAEQVYRFKLELKRDGKVREFPRFNGVMKFMELVGVKKFTVIM